mgnify:CR=1 FL=1
MNTVDRIMQDFDRCFMLGQKYWQQADSESYVENRRSETTHAQYRDLKAAVLLTLTSQDIL